jgi:hypothetical protein
MFEREPVRVGVPGCTAADRATAADHASAPASPTPAAPTATAAAHAPAARTAASRTVRFGSHRDSGTAAPAPGPVDRPARPPVATVPS